MELKTSCFLVIAAVVCWVPALAQEGGVYVKPKQGGTYVQPKKGEPNLELRQTCGGELTVDDDGEVITSPNYPNNYASRLKCIWKIKAQDPSAALEIECTDFDVTPTRNCLRGDRLLIFEGKTLRERFCGTGSKYYYSPENAIKIKFVTNRRGSRKGFSCLIRSVSENTEETTPENTEDTTTTTESNTGSCSCGVANPSRIVGGQEVNPTHKYPWHVGIKNKGGRNYWCGGSIINSNTIMTAAHCMTGESASNLVVGVADHNMLSTNDDVSGVTRLVEVKEVINHPDYSSSGNDYDIALLKLKDHLDLSKNEQIRPVCLPEDDSKTYEGVMATASGWGTLQSGGSQPNVLYDVSVPILATSCWGMNVSPRMVCAGLQEGGKDTCQGDSGGPLSVQDNSKYVQVGVTSWGYGCADANSPGVYARVSKFLSFIRSNTADSTYC